MNWSTHQQRVLGQKHAIFAFTDYQYPHLFCALFQEICNSCCILSPCDSLMSFSTNNMSRTRALISVTASQRCSAVSSCPNVVKPTPHQRTVQHHGVWCGHKLFCQCKNLRSTASASCAQYGQAFGGWVPRQTDSAEKGGCTSQQCSVGGGGGPWHNNKDTHMIPFWPLRFQPHGPKNPTSEEKSWNQ